MIEQPVRRAPTSPRPSIGEYVIALTENARTASSDREFLASWARLAADHVGAHWGAAGMTASAFFTEDLGAVANACLTLGRAGRRRYAEVLRRRALTADLAPWEAEELCRDAGVSTTSNPPSLVPVIIGAGGHDTAKCFQDELERRTNLSTPCVAVDVEDDGASLPRMPQEHWSAPLWSPSMAPRVAFGSAPVWLYFGDPGPTEFETRLLAANAGSGLIVVRTSARRSVPRAGLGSDSSAPVAPGWWRDGSIARLTGATTSDVHIAECGEADALVRKVLLRGLNVLWMRAARMSGQPLLRAEDLRQAALWLAAFDLAESGDVVREARHFASNLSPGSARALIESLHGAGLIEPAMVLADALRPALGEVPFAELRARLLFDAARFEDLISLAEGHGASTPLINDLLQEARAALLLERMLSEASPPPRRPRDSESVTKVTCILHASTPYQSGGYAVRAHGLVRALSRSVTIQCYTRPGFPLDQPHAPTNLLLPSETEHDGVVYRHLAARVPRKVGEYRYMLECAADYERVLAFEKPDVVHLRSTYLIALPGLLAARRLGIPTLYEVSGLWELVFEGRRRLPGQEGRRRRATRMESVVARHVDAAVTMTTAMKEILVARGLRDDLVLLAPNAVSDAAFEVGVEDGSLRRELGWDADDIVIGYVGSFVDYEGLDVLLEAFAELSSKGLPYRGLLVGDGAEFHRIKALRDAHGLQDRVKLTGRVPHDQVARYYSMIDVCPFPRRSTPATRVVSPLKPFEAMAAAKPIVVSYVPALAEIAEDGAIGLIVEPGDASSLAAALERLIVNATLRESLGLAGRDRISRVNRWDKVAERVLAGYGLAKRAAGGGTT